MGRKNVLKTKIILLSSSLYYRSGVYGNFNVCSTNILLTDKKSCKNICFENFHERTYKRGGLENFQKLISWWGGSWALVARVYKLIRFNTLKNYLLKSSNILTAAQKRRDKTKRNNSKLFLSNVNVRIKQQALQKNPDT